MGRRVFKLDRVVLTVGGTVIPIDMDTWFCWVRRGQGVTMHDWVQASPEIDPASVAHWPEPCEATRAPEVLEDE